MRKKQNWAEGGSRKSTNYIRYIGLSQLYEELWPQMFLSEFSWVRVRGWVFISPLPHHMDQLSDAKQEEGHLGWDSSLQKRMLHRESCSSRHSIGRSPRSWGIVSFLVKHYDRSKCEWVLPKGFSKVTQRRKFCHLQQHGWNWRALCSVK